MTNRKGRCETDGLLLQESRLWAAIGLTMSWQLDMNCSLARKRKMGLEDWCSNGANNMKQITKDEESPVAFQDWRGANPSFSFLMRGNMPITTSAAPTDTCQVLKSNGPRANGVLVAAITVDNNNSCSAYPDSL